MITQQFEEIPDANRLAMMVDLLRYENASQADQISKLEDEITRLRKLLDRASEDLDKLQQVLDMQNAQTFKSQIW